ncbi:MAG TPA: hypothetical protein DDY32_20055 [Desulfobulbaceae bacterium]|nr:hypothetical protein [Desulfobulbaceae bacterium]
MISRQNDKMMENSTIQALVVDNNPVLLKAVATILAREGCLVKSAATGLEALEIIQDYSPDIVFTDLIMPLVSGEQLCRILRNTKKHEDIFIVVLSAIILEDRERILREIACDLCIAKGNLQEIRQHVQEALATFMARKALRRRSGGMNTRIPIGLKPSEVTSELLSEKKHLVQIFANLDEGILELSGQAKIVAANDAALRILSCREELLIGRSLPEAINWGSFRESIGSWTDEQLIRQGMRSFEILEDNPLELNRRIITGSFLAVAESTSVFGLCILRDITRQYQAEKHNQELDNAIKLVKKMDAMSCMAGGVAHDFNNLLTVICGNLDIVAMYRDNRNETQRNKMIEQARRAALAAVDLTRQISCFSNFGIVSRKSTGIGQLVRTAVERFFESEPGDYTITASAADCQVYVDSDEISRAIANVLRNGIEASAGGPIEVTIGSEYLESPQLMSGQYVPAGSYAKIDIRDTGRGIDPDQLFRIFDPYYSTKERGALKGMGLGLTVVYATLRNHGGYVVVSSELHKGTTVTLFLPIQIDSGHDTGEKEKTPPRDALLIEPDNQMREIGRIMLEHLGFSVTPTGKRDEALTALRQLVADPVQPLPLAILDLSDANGESAVETCRLLHEIAPNLRVIAMSGTILDPVMQDCREYGFINTLPKPYTMDSLKHISGMVLNV